MTGMKHSLASCLEKCLACSFCSLHIKHLNSPLFRNWFICGGLMLGDFKWLSDKKSTLYIPPDFCGPGRCLFRNHLETLKCPIAEVTCHYCRSWDHSKSAQLRAIMSSRQSCKGIDVEIIKDWQFQYASSFVRVVACHLLPTKPFLSHTEAAKSSKAWGHFY